MPEQEEKEVAALVLGKLKGTTPSRNESAPPPGDSEGATSEPEKEPEPDLGLEVASDELMGAMKRGDRKAFLSSFQTLFEMLRTKES